MRLDWAQTITGAHVQMNSQNPYEPPEASLADPMGEARPGNSLDAGLAGNYQLGIGNILGEAWRLTSGMKGSFWAAVIVVGLAAVVVSVVFNFVGVLITGSAQALEANLGLQYGINLLLGAVLAPLSAGIMMMGVRRAAGLPVNFDTVFSYFGLFLPLAVLVVLQTLITNIGYLLLIIPGIYLAVAYTLSLPLAVDRRMSPWTAMETSRRAITRRWFEVFVLLIVAWLIMLAGILTIIGWVWTGPMIVNVHGIIYREIFGVKTAGAANGANVETDSGGMEA